MRTVFNSKPVALVVMDAFGKYTTSPMPADCAPD